MFAYYVKKQTRFPAMMWKGDLVELDEFLDAVGGDNGIYVDGRDLYVPSPKGALQCRVGDWLVQDVALSGKFFVCPPEYFTDSYDLSEWSRRPT